MRDIPLAIGLAAQGEFLSSRNKYFFLQKIAFLLSFWLKSFWSKTILVYKVIPANTSNVDRFRVR